MKNRFVVPALAVTALVLTGCGSPAGATDPNASEALTKVVVGVIPTGDVAPIYLGKEKGIFEKHGIDLTIEIGSGGSAITTSVISGDFQFGITNVVSLAVARDAGLPVTLVAPSSQSTGVSGEDYGAVMVAEESSISDVADLEGATIGINGLMNANDTLIRSAMDAAGSDSTTVTFIEIGFADMPAALSSGQVDAIFAPEPFMTMAADEGGRELFSLYADVVPNYPASVYFSTDTLVADESALVRSFNDAMVEANKYATDHEDEAREVITTYTSMDRTFVDRLRMPAWPSSIDEDAVRKLFELSVKYGVIENDDDVEAVLPK